MLRDFSSAAQEYTSRIGLWSKLSRKKPYSLLTPDHHILQILFGFSFFFFFWVCAQSCPTFSDCRTVAYQALLPMEFSRQEYWSALPFSNPGDFPKRESPMSPALAGRLFFLNHCTFWEGYSQILCLQKWEGGGATKSPFYM